MSRVPAVLTLALVVAIAGCSGAPDTLSIVTGPPPANQTVAALLARTSEEAHTPIRLTQGPSVESADEALAALENGTADLAIVDNSSQYRQPRDPHGRSALSQCVAHRGATRKGGPAVPRDARRSHGVRGRRGLARSLPVGPRNVDVRVERPRVFVRGQPRMTARTSSSSSPQFLRSSSRFSTATSCLASGARRMWARELWRMA